MDYVLAGIIVGSIGLVLWVLLNALFIVRPGEVGIEIVLGKINGMHGEGLHIVWPFITKIAKINTRVFKDKFELYGQTKDMQDVEINIIFKWQVNITNLIETYRRIGGVTNIFDKVVEPVIKEQTKKFIANYDAGTIIKDRDKVKEDINKFLIEKFIDSEIVVDEILMINFKFDREFERTIELIQVTKKELELAEQEKEKAKIEAEKIVEKAKGEAEALKKMGDALNDKTLLLEMYKKWGGKLPNVMAGDKTPFLISPPKEEE